MTGDRGECVDVPETSAAWAQATSTRENCLGSSCRHYQDCFVMKARKRASEADVVVVNHHLFFTDVVLRDEGAQDLLPSANTIVFDEAHHLPDLARLFFGQQVSTSQVLELARDARLAQAQHAKEGTEIGEAATAAEKAARDVRLSLGQATGRTALAQLRERARFDASLDALANGRPRRPRRRRKARGGDPNAGCDAMRSPRWANGATPTSARRKMRTAKAPKSSAGSRPTRNRRSSTSRRSTRASFPRRWTTSGAWIFLRHAFRERRFSHFQSERGLRKRRKPGGPTTSRRRLSCVPRV